MFSKFSPGILVAQNGGVKVPKLIQDVLSNQKLMSAVYQALSFASSHAMAKKNYNVGAFIFPDSKGGYYFDHVGVPAAKGFKGGNDFGGRTLERVDGSAALVISVVKWHTIQNGYLRREESIKHYRNISKEGGGMPVFVKSEGDFKSMMVYHSNYEGCYQVNY